MSSAAIVDALKSRTVAMSTALSEQLESASDDSCVNEQEIEALLRECIAGVDFEHVDSEYVFAFAFLAGLVEPRQFFEHAYQLIGLFVDDDDADAPKSNARDEEIDDEMRAQLLTLRDELLQSRLANDVPTVPGLVEFGEMTPAFVDAVNATFKRFDADGDGVLNPTEFCAYFAAVNPDHPTVDKAVQDYVMNFDCAPNGLSQVGFLQLYFSQAMSDPDEVRKDMRNAGFALPLPPSNGETVSSASSSSPAAPAPPK